MCILHKSLFYIILSMKYSEIIITIETFKLLDYQYLEKNLFFI